MNTTLNITNTPSFNIIETTKNSTESQVTDTTTPQTIRKKSFNAVWNESSKEKKAQLVFALIFLTIPVGAYYLIKDEVPRLANWAIKKILLPICQIVQKVIKAIFIDFPKLIDEHVIIPILSKIAKILINFLDYSLPKIEAFLEPIFLTFKKIALWTLDKIIQPTLKMISAVAHAIFVKLPELIYSHIIFPIYDKIKKIAILTYGHIIYPIANLISKLIDVIVITLPVLIFRHIITPIAQVINKVANWTYNYIICPIKEMINTLIDTLIIKPAKLIYNSIILPISQAIAKGAIWTCDYVLTPIGKAIQNIVYAIFISIPTFVYDNVLAPIGNFVAEKRKWTHEQIILPISQTIRNMLSR